MLRNRAKFKKLKTLMFSNDIDQKTLCVELGKSQTYLTNRMTGKQPFEIDVVYAICDYFEIPYEQISEYFPPSDIEKMGARE